MRWLLRGLLVLALLVIVAGGVVYAMSQREIGEHIVVPPNALTADISHGDPQRGQHFAVAVSECMTCHGGNGGGRAFISDAALGTFYAPNLTRGSGGAAAGFGDADWIRAVRYGVAPNGRPLLVMPSRDFSEMTDRDLADIVAYLRSLPPVDNTTPRPHVGPIGRALIAFGKVRIPADEVRADAPQISNTPIGVTPEYGHYLARIGGCMGCHGEHLSGGHLAGAPSDPPAQNLTPSGEVGSWTYEQFSRTLRTGRRPDGTSVAPFMPWPQVGQMSDTELQALYEYLKSVPPRQPGTG